MHRAARARRIGLRSTSICTARLRPCWPPGPNRWGSRSSPPICGKGSPDGDFFGVIVQTARRRLRAVTEWTHLVAAAHDASARWW